MKSLFSKITESSQPSVVWLRDVSDEKTLRKIDGAIFKAEPVGIAMKRFNAFCVNTLDLPEGEIKEKYLKETPGFYFFNPKGELIKKVVGKRATSLSSFTKLMDLTWNKSFKMRLKVFQKLMKGILDSLDKYEIQKQAADRTRAKLEEKPNPAAKRKLDGQEAQLQEMKDEIETEEKGIIEKCALRPEFAPKTDDEG